MRLICALYTLVFMVLCIVVIAIQAFGSQIAHKIIDNYPAFADATLLILSLKNVVTFLVIFIFCFDLLPASEPARAYAA